MTYGLAQSHPRRRHEVGFTLVELMVTLTVAVILMAVAVPSMKSFTETQKVKTVASDLTTALLLARSEAVKRNGSVVLAPPVAGEWLGGWSVTSGGAVLHRQEAISGVTITTALANVTYAPNGRPSTSGTFQLTGASAVRCIRLDAAGILNTKSTAC
jgi:type IV fimbrial biogenesis protein FimT